MFFSITRGFQLIFANRISDTQNKCKMVTSFIIFYVCFRKICKYTTPSILKIFNDYWTFICQTLHIEKAIFLYFFIVLALIIHTHCQLLSIFPNQFFQKCLKSLCYCCAKLEFEWRPSRVINIKNYKNPVRSQVPLLLFVWQNLQ